MRLMTLVLAGGLLWPLSAFSQGHKYWETGNSLYQQCTAGLESRTSFLCTGYMIAISDALNSEGLICSPQDSSVGQAIDVTVNYLRDHPEQRHLTAYSLARAALIGAFPCKEQSH